VGLAATSTRLCGTAPIHGNNATGPVLTTGM